jgi:O-antigen ligase
LRYTAIRVRLRVSAVALAALVLVVTASGQYWRQMGTIVSDTDYNQTAETGRLEIWKRGIGYLLEYPVFGVGANNFPAAEGTLSPLAYRQQYGVGVRWNAPHNSYIQVGAELGFPGLLLFIGLLVAAFGALSAHVRRARARRDGSAGGCNEPRLQTDLSQALTASLIGFVVGAFFLSLAYHEMLYTLVALAAGLGKVSRAPLMRAAGAR